MGSLSDDLNPFQLIRDYIRELKTDFQTFSREYHSEILKLWQEIVRIQEQLKNIRTEQKKQAKIWGLIGGAIPACIMIVIILITYWLSVLPGLGGTGGKP